MVISYNYIADIVFCPCMLIMISLGGLKINEMLNLFSLHIKSDFNKMSFIYNTELLKFSSNLHINISFFPIFSVVRLPRWPSW